MLEQALAYALHSRPVFPLVPGSKAPLTARGFKDASTDPHQIKTWWWETPDAGIGLVTGGGLVVLDIDVDKGGAGDPRWPGTLSAATRSGGWHLYFSVDRQVPCSVSRIRPGVDVRGEGGYVVAPPTPGWQWANPGHEIAPLDTMLITPLDRDFGWTPFEMSEELVGEGGRNDYLARFAGWLVRNGLHDHDDLFDTVQRENERVVAPPLDEPEVRQIVRSIGRYRDRA